MQTRHKTAAAAITALTLIAGAAPAAAACIAEGFAYSSLPGLPEDPTGPALYLKDSPDADLVHFIRLWDNRFLRRIAGNEGQLRVRVQGSSADCATHGGLRDLGTAVAPPQVIASVGGWLLERQESRKPAPETSTPQSPTAPTGEDATE